MEAKCVGELSHQYLPSLLHIRSPIKEEHISEGACWIKLVYLFFKQPGYIWCILFPPSCMWVVQSWIETVMGGVSAHIPRMFISAILLTVAPSPKNSKPNILASFNRAFLFALNLVSKFRSNNSPPIFFRSGQTNSSSQRWATLISHQNLADSTTLSGMFSLLP